MGVSRKHCALVIQSELDLMCILALYFMAIKMSVFQLFRFCIISARQHYMI